MGNSILESFPQPFIPGILIHCQRVYHSPATDYGHQNKYWSNGSLGDAVEEQELHQEEKNKPNYTEGTGAAVMHHFPAFFGGFVSGKTITGIGKTVEVHCARNYHQ